ncbi:putative membrane protein [Cinnamomum micranthum f. kanehirae]|uniref:Putative membrane protein n=1 Tax=Cinnamomum micranthum f. kanehirae TaxID=337451 RepID=A0A443NJE1_9MAGN|nr:putative membrane protein [Cinnamomum micranthum f. kanehirae]
MVLRLVLRIYYASPPLESERRAFNLNQYTAGLIMGLSKTEVNLRRLLTTAPQQQNQTKLIHYVATLREQLEQLAEEKTPEGLPRISKVKLNEYSEQIETLAAKLAAQSSAIQVSLETANEPEVEQGPSITEEVGAHLSPSRGLRRRSVPHKVEDRTREIAENDGSASIKLDAATQAHIEKHRKLQEDLTDEMVVLAQQLKESSLVMNKSLQDTEKVLDSTERAVEHSLASTGRANERAKEIYSKSTKTTCLTMLLVFIVTCVFIMIVLLIRVT